MPLVRVEVRNEYALGAPELYREASKEDPKEILEGITVAGLVGVLRQLGDLAEFAGEVFHGLQEEVTKTSSRSRKLMDRAQRIEAALSPLEKVVLSQKSHLHFAYTAGVNWHTRIRSRHSHFLYSEVPPFIMDTYEDCRDLPNLHLLDRFDTGGPGSCLKRYSDPTFFKRSSVASGVVSAKKISKDKKSRRFKKRRSWTSNGEVSRDASFSHNSGRMQFTQLNIGGHPSPTPTATTLRSELDEQSNLDLKNGSGYTEGDSQPSYSVQHEEPESRESMSSPVMRRNSDFLDYDFLREKTADACVDINLSQDQSASLSSVTWDENGETLDHIRRESNGDVVIPDNHNGLVESFSPNLNLETIGDNALELEAIEKMDVQPRTMLATAESTDTHLDDIESETDQFMDALNTIESESDTDADLGKKKELQQYSNLEDNRVRGIVCQTEGQNLEFQYSSLECNIQANDSLTSLADTSCGHLDSVSLKSPQEANGLINGVARKDESIAASLDERALQLTQTEAVSSTPGSPHQAKDEFISASAEKALQLSQTDAIPSVPGSPPRQAKDEFIHVSVEKTLQLFQPEAVSLSPGNRLHRTKDKYEFIPASIDKTLQVSQMDAVPSTPGSPPHQAKDEFISVAVDKALRVSQTDAMSTAPGNSLVAEDAHDSGSSVNKTLNSSQMNGISSIAGGPFQAKDDVSSIPKLDKTLQPSGIDGFSMIPDNPQSVDTEKNGSIISGNNVESVSCSVSPNVKDRKSRMPISDGTSSLESQKHGSDTSSISSVTFWTNGGLLGLMPSKPPDFSGGNGIQQDPVGKNVNSHHQSENIISTEEGHDMSSSNSHEYQECAASSRKPSWKISPAALNIDLSKLGSSLHSNTSSIGSSAPASGNHISVNSAFPTIRNGSSPQMLGFSSGLQPNGSNKKLLPGGDENSHAVGLQRANNGFEQKNHRSAAFGKYSGQNKGLCGESPRLSPSSSPPLQHMKISFQPMDGFETSKLKLKFPEGNTNSRSAGDIFPSFQLVPENPITRHDVGSDSDDDTFYRSSPSVSDDCRSVQSESNSEQWESSGSPPSKDPELYDALRRISLTESVSSVPEKARRSHEDIHNSCEFPTVGTSSQNSQSSQMFDHQSSGSLGHSFRKELRNGASQKSIVKPQFESSPEPPPLPPVQRQDMTPHVDGARSQLDTMPEDSYYGYHRKHLSTTISQPKPAPSNGDHIDIENLQKCKSTPVTNGQRETFQGKSINETGDFLQQIRMRSFNLRPTFIDKPTPPPAEVSSHVQVTAILKKANAIRQAVGSDEDDGGWSDT
ncbi:protein SCAR1-like isoform X2 [Andrographis paniculata]|uniref:protein SCAR1-like isoform X2 n=1 Tax=Andrographis paniculata TaxID=175694 RepID=UPI0021E8F42C|nr:protein SCAR1-like isoform X2 [Andrographis paniculata]